MKVVRAWIGRASGKDTRCNKEKPDSYYMNIKHLTFLLQVTAKKLLPL